jgi:hypothetical protein
MLDATSGYYKIAFDEVSKEKTAFAWKGGLYGFNKFPFECAKRSVIQKINKLDINEECKQFVLPYSDDIFVFLRSDKEHEKHLEMLRTRLLNVG